MVQLLSFGIELPLRATLAKCGENETLAPETLSKNHAALQDNFDSKPRISFRIET